MKTKIFKFYLFLFLLVFTSAICFAQKFSEESKLSNNSPAPTTKNFFIPQDGTPLLLHTELPLLETIWLDLGNEKSDRHFSKTIGRVGFISLNKQSKGFRNKVVTITGRLLLTRIISLKQDEIKEISSKMTPPKTIHYSIFESWILLDDEKKTPLRLITENIPIGTVCTSISSKSSPNDASNNKLPPKNLKNDHSIKNESSPSVPAPTSSTANILVNQSPEVKLNSIHYGKERIQATGVYYRLTPFTDGLDFYNTPTIIARSFLFLTKSPKSNVNFEQKGSASKQNIVIKTKNDNTDKYQTDDSSDSDNANSKKSQNSYQLRNRLLLLLPILFLWIIMRRYIKRLQNKRTPKSPFLFWGIILFGGMGGSDITEPDFINFLSPICAQEALNNPMIKYKETAKNNQKTIKNKNKEIDKNNNFAQNSKDIKNKKTVEKSNIVKSDLSLEKKLTIQKDFSISKEPLEDKKQPRPENQSKDKKIVTEKEVKNPIYSPHTDILFDIFYRFSQNKKNPENGIDFKGNIQKVEWIEFTENENFSKDLKGYYRINLLENGQLIVIYSLELPLFQINKKGLTFKKSFLSLVQLGSKDISRNDLSKNGLFSKEKKFPTSNEKSFLGIGQIIGGRGILLDAFGHTSNNYPKSFSSEKILTNQTSQDRNTFSKTENTKTRIKNDYTREKQSVKTLEKILILFKPEWYPTGIIGDLKIDAGALDLVPVFPNNALTILKKEENQLRKMGKNFNDSTFTELREKRQEVLRALRFTNSDTPFVQSFLLGIKKTSPGKLKSEVAKEVTSDSPFSVVELFNRPENWQGKLVSLKGRARRIVYIPITDEKFRKKLGQDHYYQIYLYTADSQGFPLIISVPQLPKGLEIGAEDNYREEIELTAFFCKTWAYRASGKIESNKKQDNESEVGNNQNATKPTSNSDLPDASSKITKNFSPEESTWLHAPFLIGGDVLYYPAIDTISKSDFPWPIFWGFAFLIFIFYFIYLFVRIFMRVRNRFLPPQKNDKFFDKDLR